MSNNNCGDMPDQPDRNKHNDLVFISTELPMTAEQKKKFVEGVCKAYHEAKGRGGVVTHMPWMRVLP